MDDCLARLDDCGADEELIALTKECLAPEPADRPCDAGLLAERVSAYLESVETKLRETKMGRAAEAAGIELRRRRKLDYAIATMLLVGLVTAGFAANNFRTLELAQSKLAQEKSELAARNERLAADHEVDRNAALAAREEAIAARGREALLKDKAIRLKDEADEARKISELRGEELRRSLYLLVLPFGATYDNCSG